ncbi:hypothetical protein CFOL_v3_23138 [Cephalotus follicularis]|uniref:Uncharacterized protein n=1 Tax=Cephalotus follicularis TaxID=3775 RepID=A0A1Q3CHE1_CEPFO|nr:hypothetical protein CFOL_v3_23138 [Cephalotus follicularis]
MANPRRNSQSLENPLQNQNISSWVMQLLKKPQAFPLLLSIFMFLSWFFFRFLHSSHFPAHNNNHNHKWSHHYDEMANLVKFKSGFPSLIVKDKRGWLLNPISLALDSRLKGGAVSCTSIHLGEIQPGAMRGNHRHHTCNETFVIWGAKTLFRLENNHVGGKGYAEMIIGVDEVAVAASPSGTAHALVNVDPIRSAFFIGCQDSIINYNSTMSDFNVWKDL